MNKAELISAAMERNPEDFPSKAAANRVISSVFDIIAESLEKHESVQIVGFGTFLTDERAERIGRNPQTGEELVIPATVVPKFKAGKTLKSRVAS